MTEEQAKTLALFKILDEEFTNQEVKGMLVGVLLGFYDDDEKQVIDFLQSTKSLK